MSRADRAFVSLVLASAGLGALLLIPVLITVFPGAFERALHGYETLAQQCVAALYGLGVRLPPLGAVTLAIGGASAVWGAACGVALLRRTHRALEDRRPLPLPDRLRDAAERVGVRENVVCFSGAVPNAYCAGLLRPRIWVSTGAVRRLKRRELEVVLWHESYHLQRRDPLRVFVARVLSSTLVILPILRSLAERFEAAKELDADQVALRRPGTTRALAGALIKMGQRPLDRQRLAIGAWSSSHARVDQVCGADAAALLPVATARARWLTSFALAVALLLALGQAARANLVPAAAFDSLGLGAPPSEIHSCPIPHEGVLL